jgi:hypothetical protein
MTPPQAVFFVCSGLYRFLGSKAPRYLKDIHQQILPSATSHYIRCLAIDQYFRSQIPHLGGNRKCTEIAVLFRTSLNWHGFLVCKISQGAQHGGTERQATYFLQSEMITSFKRKNTTEAKADQRKSKEALPSQHQQGLRGFDGRDPLDTSAPSSSRHGSAEGSEFLFPSRIQGAERSRTEIAVNRKRHFLSAPRPGEAPERIAVPGIL